MGVVEKVASKVLSRRYQILGVFLLVQLCILAAEGLRRSNISSFTNTFQQSSVGAHQTPTGYLLLLTSYAIKSLF